MNKINDIGQLKGKVLVFGGVYSNLHALEAMYGVAQKLAVPAENIICTGDIAGYCAFPNECLEFMQRWGIHAITGNVEENIRDGLDDCGCGFGDDSRCDIFARMWYPYARDNTREVARDYIADLPAKLRFEYAGKAGMVIHGSYAETAEFVWQSSEWAKKELTFEASGANLILAGHCGLPFADQKDGKTWLNAGVIGMPANDGTNSVWYLLLDDKNNQLTYEFNRLEYDYQAARTVMLEKPLPKSYALTLQNGLWDNTEIMPAAEAGREGQPLTSEMIDGTKGFSVRPEEIRSGGSENTATLLAQKRKMDNKYYDPKDLKKFGQISEYQEEMGKQFFDWYENVTHGDSALTQREKSLIALAVSHAIQCPYCIDAYTTGSLESGADEEQMMEAVHVAAAIKAGTTLIYSLQMKRQIEKLTM